MEDNHTEQSEPTGRLRLYLFAAVMLPLFMALALAIQTGSVFYIFRSQTQVLGVAIEDDGTGQWAPLQGLPGIPLQLEATANGSLWATTQLPGSISRYNDGRWEVFRSAALGTTRNSPRHDFAIVGERLWAVFGDKLMEFDGRQWQKHPIADAAADHVIAANGETVWVLGNDGLLRTRVAGRWLAPQVIANAQVARWDREKSYLAPRLLVSGDGGLWLCGDQLWRKHEDKWTPVELGGRPLIGAEVVGYADGKIWLDDPLGIIWVAEDQKTSGQFSKKQLGLDDSQRVFSVHGLGNRTCATSSKGIHVLDRQQWELKWPLPESFHRCKAMVAADGRIYTIALGPIRVAFLWMATALAAVLSVLGLLAIRLVLKPKYSMFHTLGRRHAIAIVAVTLPMILGAIVGMSSSMFPVLVPIALSMLFMLVPPLLTILVVASEMSQRFREVIQLRPVAASRIPPAFSEWFEKNTMEVELLGFRRIGDYRLKKYREHFARFFINSAGDVLGEISCVKILPWKTIKCFSCFSITDDLTYLETGTLATGNVVVPKTNEAGDDRFILQGVPRASVGETLDAHQFRLEQLSDTRSTLPICFVEDDLDKVVIYGQKLLYDCMIGRGQIASNPYDNVTFAWNKHVSPEELVDAL